MVTARFWAKVDRADPDGCWQWKAGRNDGYGRFKLRGHHVYAHRFAYEMLIGSVPDGLTLDHLCRNRACVNPSHLEPVSNRVNVLRGVGMGARHARATRCPQGHPYDETNTYLDTEGFRSCRSCRRTRNRERKARLRRLVAA